MQLLMDSNYVDQSSFSLPLNESSFAIKGVESITRKEEEQFQQPPRNFSSNINAPAGDATENLAGTDKLNFLFEDDEEEDANVEVDVRLSDPTPKKTPNFDIEKIRF